MYGRLGLGLHINRWLGKVKGGAARRSSVPGIYCLACQRREPRGPFLSWAAPTSREGSAPPLETGGSPRAAGSLAAIGGRRSGAAGLWGEVAVVAQLDLRTRGPCSALESPAPRQACPMAVLAVLLRGCARGRSPLLRLQMQVRGVGARRSACPVSPWQVPACGPAAEPRCRLRTHPSAGPAQKAPQCACGFPGFLV